MSYPFESVVIIYNPTSTGDSEGDARQLKDQLHQRLPEGVAVELKATNYAGHAEKIAYEYAIASSRVLLVSASGDGGYHEVVNGALGVEDANLAVVVVPSGNANDHHQATARGEIVDRITSGQTRLVDIIEVESTIEGKRRLRYAHSYVGVGMTAYIGKKLNATELNPVNEKFLVLKYLMRFGHVTLRVDEDVRWRRYSSLLVANIDRMSKIIKLSDGAELDDGKFEVYRTFRQPVIKTLKTILAGAVFGLESSRRTENLTFISKNSSELQCDGEIYQFDGGELVTIRAHKQRLKTLA